MKLKALKVDKKTAWFEYPSIKGFFVQITMLSRVARAKLATDNTIEVSKYDQASSSYYDTKELQTDKFVDAYVKEVITGWKGLKMMHLDSLGLFDIGDANPEEEIPFTHEDAVDLVSNSELFDKWVNDVSNNLDNFRKKPNTGTVEKAGEVVPGV